MAAVGSPGFEEETRIFLQARLRAIQGVVAITLVVAMVAMVAARAQAGWSVADGLIEFCTHPSTAAILPLASLSGGLWVFLDRQVVAARTLVAIDGFLLQCSFGLALAPYLSVYAFSSPGHVNCVATLSIVILVRSIAVPSTGLRTFLFSLPAPAVVLASQLYYGGAFAHEGEEPYSERYFAEYVVLNQFLMAVSILGAVLASRTNLGLRQRTFDAARLGPYELGRRIGAGAMGEVFEATHAMLKRPTAIKLLRPEITGEQTLRRFEQEVQQASRLSHPNTVSIFDYGHTPAGVFYYAMELLVGSTLRELVERDGPMSIERTIRVLSNACGALSEAHDKGMVHRDIKPENLMLCEQGGEHDVLKILDFGLVKDLSALDSSMSADGVVIGSPETMAPELLSGGVGPRADIYSLCAVGCYLLTGKPIFDAENLGEFVQAHQLEDPIDPRTRNAEVPAELAELLLRNLRKDPDERHPDAGSLRDDLLAVKVTGGST